MTADEKRKIVKRLFKGYKKMTRNLEHGLEEMGIQVEHTKNTSSFFITENFLPVLLLQVIIVQV